MLALFCFPVVRIGARSAREREQRAQYLVHLAFRFHVRLMQALGVCNCRFGGASGCASRAAS